MIRTVLAVAAVALGVTAGVAQENPIEARKTLMKANGQHAGAVGRMVRGENPFDVAKVNEAFAQFTDTAQKLGALFPDNSKTGETRALPKVWDDRTGFNAAVAKFGKDVADNRDKAKTLDDLKVVWPMVSRNCGSCHETYRRPQT